MSSQSGSVQPVARTSGARRAPHTPRKRKKPAKDAYGLKKQQDWTPTSIRKALVEQLGLTYTPEDWQVEALSRINQGYDSIVLAGTGYGKSLLFEGTVTLAGEGKLTVIIVPLKALAKDQVNSAREKDLDAVTIHEDTPDEERPALWKRIRETAQMVYISPEMALSNSFKSLWADAKFRRRLAAVFVDEAHCIDEWGTQDFRPEYRMLNRLRSFTGQDVPFVAVTATCPTSTFDTIWSSLTFGCRPFSGIDVGADRPNLFFHTRVWENPSNPVIDLLTFLPPDINDDTPAEDIPKMLVYINSEARCREIRDQFRRVLPAHLRDSVRAFSSDLSETAKDQI